MVCGGISPADFLFDRHETLVMVSGGSGITPFMSVIRGLVHASSNAQKTPKVVFSPSPIPTLVRYPDRIIVLICAFKSSSDLAVLELLLPLSATCPATFANLDIRIEAYVTREREPSTESSKVVSTIWFKPKKSDTAISPTLGPNSWLFLAVIISSSFVMSLILIGFLTRYLIYPTDKNTDKIYSNSLKTLIYMASFCSSIVFAASAAFMWSKRRCDRDASQVNHTVTLPDSAHGSCRNDTVLESQPEKSLARVTNVRYGARPDLRRILSERGDGSSTGVLVCGPKEMQRDVASVCSAASAANIHLEFISFSW
uniref:Ferric reductase NAD binding domain-containing protein n=1 Tax=Kalanchoe fedtschenkoi TaxID=63787 RepID=A0A7N0UC83_KALFE